MGGINPGDLVVCVAHDDGPPPRWYPQIGGVYRVAAIYPNGAWGPVIDLCEDPYPDPEWAWAMENFRKIDKADESFTETVRACRPVRQREPA